ncbi:hypothetical protein [Thermomonospora cellulosilytica]|uniref:Lipoprotein n=1 Tax=Thermomonospora cellulosilytica TaxID=1411118 RepID=A0A7W3MW19_9ACTN|nr:hypothetical protein [Thermomonospora cellulosilytica]MBA9002964.1 hypothetical protein [Thermomonospora cellulosilytica]
MRRFLAALVPVLVPALTSCGSPAQEAGPAPSKPAAPASPTSAPPSVPPSPTRTPTTETEDCFDGDCLLEVTRPVDIELDRKKFYYPGFSVVSVDENSLTYHVEYPHGGGAEQVLSPGGGSSFGFRDNPSVEVRLVSIKDGKALLSISPGTSP